MYITIVLVLAIDHGLLIKWRILHGQHLIIIFQIPYMSPSPFTRIIFIQAGWVSPEGLIFAIKLLIYIWRMLLKRVLISVRRWWHLIQLVEFVINLLSILHATLV